MKHDESKLKDIIDLDRYSCSLAELCSNNIAAAIVSAGAFIAFAIIESREMKILNEPDKED